MADQMQAPGEDVEPALNVVEVETDDGGLALIIYGPGPDFCVEEIAFIPAEHRVEDA
ncbi:hypothetical protein [Streptomyces sp. NPDC047070]|uniref:hypothetical protein n=1 Tax=Streptomyces sp. NPDC047070 TaxID=3154923 RepID=UPI003453121D